MVSLIKLLKLLLGLDKLSRPKGLVLLCVTGHTRAPNYNEFLRLFACRKTFSFLARLQNKNPESVWERPGTTKAGCLSGTAGGVWVPAADGAAARSERCAGRPRAGLTKRADPLSGKYLRCGKWFAAANKNAESRLKHQSRSGSDCSVCRADARRRFFFFAS